MPSLCLYFQVHQPYRMRPYHLFEIGQNHHYFDEEINKKVCQKVAQKCYLPANELMLKLIKRFPGHFKLSYSITGSALEQFEAYAPEVIESFQKLVATGQVELLSETYYHSLASLFSPTEFNEQVKQQERTLKKIFGVKPSVFRNTELIYSDTIAQLVNSLGYKGILTEGADHILEGKSPNYPYQSSTSPLTLLLKNYQLSDDIAFRFSNQSWKEWPLSSQKFAHWVHALDGQADCINLFMDYETIGEHQWEASGIFTFFEALPAALLSNPRFDFCTPSDLLNRYPAKPVLKISQPISWADQERDTSAWLGNPMQDSLIKWLYSLENTIKERKDPALLKSWRKLQTSDHFYYMCTKHWNDGDVHKYFSVYERPHDSYTIMNNILTDMELTLKKPKRTKKATYAA